MADTFMTYRDSSHVGSAFELDTVVTRINLAFSGPLDTLMFGTKLQFTGYRAISEVPYLEQNITAHAMVVEPGTNSNQTPNEFALYQNYPNPFNPVTQISFSVGYPSNVTLKVYDVLGREVSSVLSKSYFDQGAYQVPFNATSLPSGVYFYRITAEPIAQQDVDASELPPTFTDVKKMAIIK